MALKNSVKFGKMETRTDFLCRTVPSGAQMILEQLKILQINESSISLVTNNHV